MISVWNTCCRDTPIKRTRFALLGPATVRRRIPEDCGGPTGYQHLLEARCSWEAVEQVCEDVLLVAQRVLAFSERDPRPTYEDAEFMDAFERIREREATAPVPFNRRTVNTTLRTLIKEA